MITHIRIQPEDFDLNEELAALASEGTEIGALASFIGIVRRDDGLTSMTLEHYPGMTEREIVRHVNDAASRWSLEGVTIIHRIGKLNPGDRIVLVAVASRRRAAAFEACAFLMDYLKTHAPFWKQEERGTALSWVDAKSSDDDAVGRWRTK